MFQAQIPLDKKELFMRKSVLISKRAIVLTGLVLALSAAVYLNWQYSGGNDSLLTASRDETKIGQSIYVNNTVSNTAEEDYFSKTATEREKSRNNTVAEFDGIINNAKSSDEAKKKAETNKNTIINNMEKEINIETLVKAKGFEKCIAVVSEKNVNVIVKAKQLTSAQTIQINEIACEQTGFTAENVKIITVE